MPIRKQQLVNNEIYHIIIRGIENSLIFKDISDYYRGIFSIYEFNTTEPITIRERRIARLKTKKSSRRPSSVNLQKTDVCDSDARDKLVEILTFCFMPNHIHLLIKQIKNEGITKFMRKLGTGYAKYFREKYEQKGKGYFFQGRFASVHIKTNDQLKNVFVYIHSNAISLIEPKWKEKGIKNPKKVIKFLENYKWSSYPDYLGKKNFPSVTERDFMLKVMGGEKDCKEFVENWVKYKGEITEDGRL